MVWCESMKAKKIENGKEQMCKRKWSYMWWVCVCDFNSMHNASGFIFLIGYC